MLKTELADLLLQAAGALRDNEDWADDPQSDSLLADRLETAASSLTEPAAPETDDPKADVTVNITVEDGMPDVESVSAAGISVMVNIRDYDTDGVEDDAPDVHHDDEGRMYVERGSFHPGTVGVAV